MSCLVLIAALGAIAAPAVAANARIATDGMLVVNGERTFVLGLYENPDDDAALAQVANAGFNLVRASESKEALDRLHDAGLFAWINTGERIELAEGEAEGQTRLAAMVDAWAQHPALLVWEVPDEALWNCWYRAIQWRHTYEPAQLRGHIAALDDATLAEELGAALVESARLRNRGDIAESEEMADAVWRKLGKESPKPDLNISNAPERAARLCERMILGYETLRTTDPAHPVWMNHAPRNTIAQLAAFNRGADIVGCDIYPAPAYRGGHSDLADRSLASVGAYTDRMQAAAPGKPVWMVLQGFGWADLSDNPDEEARARGRRPTFEESRFMAYDALVHGARGILYWGTYRIEKDSQLRKDLMALVRELAELGEVLAAPDASVTATVMLAEAAGSLDRGVRVLGKELDGRVWWLVVNEYQDPLNYTLEGLDALDGIVYHDEKAERSTVVRDGSLSCTIRGHGIQVLAPSNADM